jgi:CBS domain-containing protein
MQTDRSRFARFASRLAQVIRKRKSMNVEKIMTKSVKSCMPEHSAAEAARIMWEHDCGCVPVVDESDRIVGMITDRDICMAAYLKGRDPQEIPVRDIMCAQVFTCRPDDTVQTAERVMRRAQVRRLPVTNASNRLVGILSLNDIAREAEREQRISSPEVGLEDVALTLSAVGHQHSSLRTASLPS